MHLNILINSFFPFLLPGISSNENLDDESKMIQRFTKHVS